MSQLRKISGLLSSFVSSSDGEIKRKRLETDNTSDEEEEALPPPLLLPEHSAISSPTKKLKTEHILDAEAYLTRVSTFTHYTWCRDAPALSPLEVARHGWFATDKELLVRCSSCRENLSLALPPPDSGVRQTCMDTAYSRLTTAHLEFCPWAAASSPMDWTKVQIPNVATLAEEVLKIAAFDKKLPFLREELLRDWEVMVEELGLDLLEEQDNTEVRVTSILLAVCGWKVSDVPDCLVDHYSIRRLGLWNFVSIQEEEDDLESRLVAQEMGHTVTEERREPPGGKTYLDPIAEHLSWHPLLQVQEGGGEVGWRWLISYYRRMAARRTGAANRSEQDEKKDHTANLSRFRRLLANW